ncbi:MAG: hypothetical protein R3Y47_12120 [Lachnospiraceae bacterium]
MTHADRLIRLEEASIGRKKDSSMMAALYLLSSTSDMFAISRSYVSKQGIDFDGMKKQTSQMSGNTNLVIDIAYNLYTLFDDCRVEPSRIANLEYPYMTKVCEAIYVASGKCNLKLFKDEADINRLELDLRPYEQTKEDEVGVLNIAIILAQK